MLLLLQGRDENICKSASTDYQKKFYDLLESLSTKQLKDVLTAKVSSFESTKKDAVLGELKSVLEKPNLVTLVADHVDIAEIGRLLSLATQPVSQLFLLLQHSTHLNYPWIKFSLPHY